MIPVLQDVFGVPDGNCWTACVASILEVALSDLRDVQRMYREMAKAYPGTECERLWGMLQNLLCDNHGVLVLQLDARAPRGYAIAGGEGPRGFAHCVVALDGELVHDPHPDGGFLVGPVDDYMILQPMVRRTA